MIGAIIMQLRRTGRGWVNSAITICAGRGCDGCRGCRGGGAYKASAGRGCDRNGGGDGNWGISGDACRCGKRGRREWAKS